MPRCTLAHPVLVPAAVAALTVVLVLAVAAPAASAGPPGADVTYQPPVDAPVADPFRAPATPYGPGNRGLAYDLADDTPVRAAAEGTVVFAGAVAGTRHVTVLHADGLRTSYSFLSEVLVRRGDAVRRGDIVGAAGAGSHLGARDGDAYLDPADLFDATVVRVRLVPHTEPLPPSDAGLLREQASLRDLVRAERPGLVARVAGAVARRAAPIVDAWVGTARATWHTWDALDPASLVLDAVESYRRHRSQPCTPGDVAVAPPAGERTAVLVGGLGSSSASAAIDDVDVGALGYDEGEVLRFSYGGGRVPTAAPLDPGLAGIPEAPYDPADTLEDIEGRGRELADLVVQAAAARPGVPVDLYAHSMGGLVTRAALQELAARPGGLDALGQVVTIGTPHAGADLATLAVISEDGFAQDVADIRAIAGIDVDPYATSVGQMAETSSFVDALRASGVPDGVRFRTVAARGDLVVSADKADVDDQPAAIIDAVGTGAHAGLPGDPQTTRELLLGLAAMDPACQSTFDAVADAVVPEVVQAVTDAVALGTAVVT
ncbi:MAG TPA: peptidoglycan DD-metalloendopeptidase family protein [Acidimicrobiales bacterium]|nr:peptidoglycan DD-metalloendopeptidase family protein [Acidimicrobiales bacterium]